MTREILGYYDKNWGEEPKLVDMQDVDGNTALHLAVEAGREKVANILLGQKPNLALKYTHVPLFFRNSLILFEIDSIQFNLNLSCNTGISRKCTRGTRNGRRRRD